MAPLISVVVPTCRRPDLLGRCLDRLAPVAQTFPADRYEVIVTDDGEPTAERVVAERFPWAVWVRGPRRGPAANRNSGARKAGGDWLAFTDDDCVADPGWLAGFAAAAGGGGRVFEGKTTCEAGICSPLDHAPANLTGGFLWSCNMLIHRDTFTELGGFDEAFPHPHMEDVDFRERLRRAGHRIDFVPAAVIDHPPRRLPTGRRLAATHESDVYYWYKCGRRGLATPSVLLTVLRFRLAALWRHRPGHDSVLAIGSMAAELGSLVFLLPVWEARYRRRFREHPNAYLQEPAR